MSGNIENREKTSMAAELLSIINVVRICHGHREVPRLGLPQQTRTVID